MQSTRAGGSIGADGGLGGATGVWGNSTVCQRVRVFRMFYEVREVVSPSVSLFFFCDPFSRKFSIVRIFCGLLLSRF